METVSIYLGFKYAILFFYTFLGGYHMFLFASCPGVSRTLQRIKYTRAHYEHKSLVPMNDNRHKTYSQQPGCHQQKCRILRVVGLVKLWIMSARHLVWPEDGHWVQEKVLQDKIHKYCGSFIFIRHLLGWQRMVFARCKFSTAWQTLEMPNSCKR